MSDGKGPWCAPGKTPSGEPPLEPPIEWRFFVWLALVVAGGLAIWELSRLFPGALADRGDQAWLVQYCVILAVVASGIVYSRRFTAREAVRNVAIWCGVVAVLVFGYVFTQRFQDAALDARSELAPGYAVETGDGRIVLSESSDGDFTAIGKVNGTTVAFMVDTGASDIVLSPDDAARAGIDVASLHFNRRYETAHCR